MTWLTKTITALDNTRTISWLVALVAASALPLTYVLLCHQNVSGARLLGDPR